MEKIAIIGLSCEYPDASSPNELWENILSQKKSFRKIPENRLPLNDYYSDDLEADDKIYSSNAAVIEGYNFDRVKFKVSGQTYRSTDLTHWLALDVATRAFEDAGFLNERSLPKEKTGVIVGNTLTGEFSRSSIMRLRWPYVQKVLSDVAISEGWSSEEINNFLLKAEHNYKNAFAKVSEDTLAGGLSNTIAGRICNYYDLKGGGYSIDGACSSSLLSVANGCNRLESREIDLALVGGVDLSLDPFELIGFSKTRALAKEEMKIYDKNSNGFWPGEGCGFALLMRYEDAIKQGHKIYATVNGWGISSDGHGGLTRPEVDGQTLAISRAYKNTNYSIDKVQYFEGHGTGTPVGDNVELTTINNAIKNKNSMADPAYIGSIKGNIGHTKAAAGLAGFIKAILSIHNKVIPPVTSNEEPHNILVDKDSKLKVTKEPLPWSSDESLKAGVSSMGFGGINVHLTLEGVKDIGKTTLSPRESFLSSSYQDAEIFIFSENNKAELTKKVDNIKSFAERLSYSELSSLAKDLFQKDKIESKLKAAIVASTPKELVEKLDTLLSWIRKGEESKIDNIQGIYLGKPNKAKVGFLFPGQGAPVKKGAGSIRTRFRTAREFYNTYPEKYEGDLKHTSNAQTNIIKSSLVGLNILNEMNIKGNVGLGHSLGELTALYWAGCLQEEEVIELAKARGKAMSNSSTFTSGMASVLAPPEDIQPFLVDDVVISGYNAHNQTVISGGKDALTEVIRNIKEKGFYGKILPVSHGFHSHYMENGKEDLYKFLKNINLQKPKETVISSITGKYLRENEELTNLLVNQLTQPVLFTEAMNKLKEENLDYIIEIGPGKVLSGIISEELGVPVAPLETDSESINSLLKCVAISYVLNKEVELSELFNRYIKPLKSIETQTFFTNPCESIERQKNNFEESNEDVQQFVAATNEVDSKVKEVETTVKDDSFEPLNILKQLLSEKIELPVESISNTNRLLDDLHLNSITVGQIIAQAANELEVSSPIGMTEYANATIEEVADILRNQLKSENFNSDEKVEVVDSWIGTFHVDREVSPLIKSNSRGVEENDWQLFIDNAHPLYSAYKGKLEKFKGKGILVALTPNMSEKDVSLLLEGAKKGIQLNLPFVVIQHGLKTSSSFAKSYYLESGLDTKVINVPLSESAFTYIENELKQVNGFTECFYDNDGLRTSPVLTPINLNGAKCKNITSDDVILYTGGGKGIASECALELASETKSKLAIIGRSNPKEDKQLHNTIARAKDLNVQISYYQADVKNPLEVKKAIEFIENEMGPITGFTHAAGINKPKSLTEITQDEFEQTIATKVIGCKNVLDCLSLESLKFFVSFSSIIGRSGLQGESHYGIANEWLTNLTEDFAEHELMSKSLSIEWSVWSGVGMGQNLGTIESLKKQGIIPIPLEEGVRLYKSMVYDLVNQVLPTNTIIVSGRMGSIPTINYENKIDSFSRFVEKVKVHYPEYELISDVNLHPEKDLYLHDHILEGEYLFPAVIGLEAMAQVSMALNKSKKVPNFQNVKFNHPIIVDNEGTDIRIVVVKKEHELFKVSILSEATNYSITHFEANCSFSNEHKDKQDIPSIKLSNQFNSINPKTDMYGKFLFQEGRFAQVKRYIRSNATESLAILNSSSSNWFQDYLPQTLILGDPGARDAAIHSLQACIPQKVLIPLRVSSITQKNSEISKLHERVVYGKEIKQEGDMHHYNLFIYDLEGQVIEVWEDVILKEVSDTGMDFKMGPLLSTFIERQFRSSYSSNNIKLVLESFEEKAKANNKHVIFQLLGEEGNLYKREDGSPIIYKEGNNISFSNHQKLIMGVKCDTNVACDIEPCNREISIEDWKTMLGERLYNLAEQVSSISKESLSVSCTRVWTILECLKKSEESTDSIVNLVKVENNGIHFKTGDSIIASYMQNDFILTILVEENNNE